VINFRRTVAGLISGVLILLMFVGGFWWLNQPIGRPNHPHLIDIPPGTPFTQVSRILHQNDLIGPEWFFTLLGRVQRVDRNIIPGEYELHAGMRPTELLEKLVKGEVYKHALTIPEGYNIVQIADVLDKKNLARKQEILELTRDQGFIQSLNIQASTLEGYLFPDTYLFARYTPPESIIRTFVKRFHEVVIPDLIDQAMLMGMTLQSEETRGQVAVGAPHSGHRRP
jgi:UPF0755 protein